MPPERYGRAYTPPENRRRGKEKRTPPGRLALGTAAAVAVIALAAIYGERVWDSIYQGKSRAALNGPIADLLKEPVEEPDQFEPGTLIPEDERSGENMLVAAHLINKFSAPEEGYAEYFSTILKSFLDDLPKGTNVHVVITDENKDACLTAARKLFPHLNFSILEMPYGGQGVEFIQDHVFATGSTDENGRFQIASSSRDREAFKRDTDCYWEPWWASMSKDEAAQHAAKLFTDDFLGKRYPDKFETTDVNLRFEGGDLHVTRLPDGRTALVIGAKTIADNLVLYKEDCPPYKMILRLSKDEAISRLFEIKNAFKKRFGVDDVIVLGEDALLRRTPGLGNKPEPAVPSLFFHTDMVLKTATNKTGEHIAFCTDYDPSNFEKIMQEICDATGCYNPDGSNAAVGPLAAEMEESVMFFLQSVQLQFQSLGYRVIKLPCGVSAVLNYTNSVMFTGKNGEKFAIVPQYGIPEDAIAIESYKQAGFTVLTGDYANFVKSVNEDVDWNNWWAKRSLGEPEFDAGMNDNGSWHCRNVVLGSTAPTPKKTLSPEPKKQPVKEPKGWKQPHMAPGKQRLDRQKAEINPKLGRKKGHIPPYQRQIYSPVD